MAARRVVRPLATKPGNATRDVFAAFSLLAETIVLQLQHRGEGEAIIGAGGIDILRPDACIRPKDFLGIITGDPSDWPALIVHVGARLATATYHRSYKCGSVTQIACPLGAGDDDARGVVSLHAAIEKMQWLADHPAVDDVINRVAPLVESLRIVRSVFGMHDFDHRHLLGLGA